MIKQSVRISIYPIVIEPCEEGGFFASCPVLQGCHADGETYGEAIDNIREVISMHIAARKKSKHPFSSVILKNPSEIKIELSVPVEA